MSVTQLAVFIQNKPGRLAAVTRILGDAGVNIRGFSIADTEDYGILRLLVNREDAARDALRAGGFTVHESQVILVEVPDQPGGFAGVLDLVAALGVNVEYTYATAGSLIAFGVSDRDAAEALLRERGVRLLTNEALSRL
ncbi:MAG TPA: ACT domain-containing protein [Armatimonadota bacterium]|nr:ACT domain-containing protein [Armatimonadota bacterium]HOS43224.1 ACT domain-containing protein [Armatimonadota bacterium]